jgi:hypothetical protein
MKLALQAHQSQSLRHVFANKRLHLHYSSYMPYYIDINVVIVHI